MDCGDGCVSFNVTGYCCSNGCLLPDLEVEDRQSRVSVMERDFDFD